MVKKFMGLGLTAISGFIVSGVAFAGPNKCVLPDSYDPEVYQDVTEGKKVNLKRTFSQLEAMQILITARYEAKQSGDADKIVTLRDAVRYLVNNSEAGEVYINDQRAGGIVYTVVLYYPGGNPVGVVFTKGTKDVVGYIEDSTVVCK